MPTRSTPEAQAGVRARAHRRPGGRDAGAQVRLEGRRPGPDHEQHLHAEERLAHLGLHHRRHRRRRQAADVDTNFFLFQYAYFDETRSFGKDQLGWLVLQTTSPSVNEKVAKAIDATFANSPYETATDTEKAFNKAFAAQLGNIALIVVLVVGAAFVTILMIVGNTMALTDPRAHARDRRAQDARVFRPPRARHGARRIGSARPARRVARAGARLARGVLAARQHGEFHAGLCGHARDRASSASR